MDGSNTRSREICWYSCGAASAVAAYLSPKSEMVYCETGSEHADSARFMSDCERWLGRDVTTIRSDDYQDTWDVWEKTRWLAGVSGARCTIELKVVPRLEFQNPHDVHIFGYTADARELKRAENLRNNFPELTIKTPLIDAGLTKATVLSMIEAAGIELPVMYKLGFHNNNCIPCVKATSPGYWALVRRHFPDQFVRMASLSRELGVRLCRIEGERRFIDEIPHDWPTTDPIQPSCDFLCHIIEQDIERIADGLGIG